MVFNTLENQKIPFCKISLQDCLSFRLTLLIPLLTTIKMNKEFCKMEEFTKTLLTFLVKPMIYNSPNDDLFSYCLCILDNLLIADIPNNDTIDTIKYNLRVIFV